ncbi:MAG TPA: TIR domain-containing protein, partial [Candidatus Sabulitectum sp.]|nr:TIR domain-containing protein [Candidatus Sabulitectum sp.]
METPSVSQVFLSHSTNDTGTVEKVLAFLEDHGFPCWIAPRDIAPGEDWPAAIASAVDQCPVFILFVSESSNRSGQVRIELERAVAAESKIIPLFIDECKPTGWMEYFISSRHWHSLDLTRLNDSLAELLPVICALGDQAFSRDITLLDSFLMDELNALEAGVSILEERPESSLVPGRMRSLCVISVGILGIAGRPGDEASSLIRSSVTRIVEQAIRGYGGVPEILDRDVTLGFFGLRETREDDIRRAVSCAIRIRRMMEKMNEKLRNTGFSAQFGTGVSSGMVRAGEGASGIPLKSEKTVQEAIDLASSEGLWVSEGTKSRCSRLFNWQRDERGWTVHESTSSLAGFRSGFNPAFQGRSAQISRLMNLFIEGCSKGENTCARIVGESGIGKTRFAELVAEKVSSASGAMIFRGSCHPFSETPLYTIRALVDSIAIPGNLLSQGHNAALLKRVRGETLSDEDCLPDDPELETALFLSALLSHDSGSSPAVLLLLDDAQWMDRESRKVLSRLFTYMDTGFPVLFLIVERTSPGNMSEMFPYAEDIHLEGLSHKEIEAIVLEMLETRSGEKNTRVFMDTMDHLARVSRGNPLSLISLIDHLLESDLISDETGKWRLTGKVGDLPEGDLRDILLWRLSQFDASVNGLLQVCAVTSGVFDADVIHSISARAGCVTVPPGMILHRLKDTGLVTSV